METLLELLVSRGLNSYDGEQVTQLEHALQSAAQAFTNNLPEHLIVSALFHDVGHLIYKNDNLWDNRHEYSGSALLKSYFPEIIWMPVFLHVTAKRYLSRDNEYYQSLSNESKRSLTLQGGKMNDIESIDFETNTYFNDAIYLRKCDDNAKTVGKTTNQVESYIPLIKKFIVKKGSSSD